MPKLGTTLDTRGFFPDPGKTVKIAAENGRSIWLECSNVQVWVLVLPAQMFIVDDPPTAIIANSPDDALKMFSVVSWDAQERTLTVKFTS